MPKSITGKGTGSLRRHSPSGQKVSALLTAPRTAPGPGVPAHGWPLSVLQQTSTPFAGPSERSLQTFAQFKGTKQSLWGRGLWSPFLQAL